MSRSIAINVGANTSLPGFRGPVYPDGSFVYVPIPEREAAEGVPTYADLALPVEVPEDVADRPVHHDPQFAGYLGADRYLYGDEHGVKAGPLADLERGDSLFFYATLTSAGDPEAVRPWIAPDWGAYLIGEFRVARALTGEEYRELPADDREAFAANAHVRRAEFDAKVLVEGGPDSRLFDRVVPLSSPTAGAEANRLVTELSNDSGKGPWWRRRFWYDEGATAELRERVDRAQEGKNPLDRVE